MAIYRGWKVALAAAGINFLVGINYTWSIFATGLVDQFNWTYYQAALPYSLFILCYASFMVLTGWAQDYLGPKPVITIGSIIAGAAFISCAYILHQPFTAAVTLGLLLGVGLSCCFAATTPAAMKWFSPEKKGLITGLVVTTTGLAALIMSPAIRTLVENGVDEALMISGVLVASGIFILARFIENPPYRVSNLREWDAAKKSRTAFGDYRLYLFWLMFFLTTGTGVTFAAHLNNIMRIQVSYDKGYIAVALFAMGNAAGRLLGGILSDRLGRSKAMTAVFSNIAVMLVIAMLSQTPRSLITAVVLASVSYGALFSIFPSAVVSLFGEANFGRNYGMVFTALGAAGIFPYLAGVFFETQGHYLSTYALLLLTTLTAVAISVRLRNSLV